MWLSNLLDIYNTQNSLANQAEKMFNIVPILIVVGFIIVPIIMVGVIVLIVHIATKKKKSTSAENHDKIEEKQVDKNVCAYCGTPKEEGKTVCSSCGSKIK